MAVRRHLLVAVGLIAAACTDDDDGDADHASTSTDTTVAVVAPTPSPPASTTPATTLPPPANLDELTAGLLAADEVGVPSTWAIRDIDPAILDADMTVLADPFQGLLTCPDGALRPAAGWLQRTFSGAEPLDTGMLRVDLVLAVQDAAGFDAQQAALGACTAGEQSALAVSTGTFGEVGGHPAHAGWHGVDATTLALATGPSADVPYPSAYALVAANRDGRTVTVVVGGIDLGVPFEATAAELVARSLARL